MSVMIRKCRMFYNTFIYYVKIIYNTKKPPTTLSEQKMLKLSAKEKLDSHYVMSRSHQLHDYTCKTYSLIRYNKK